MVKADYALLRQTNTANQILKARVIAQGIHEWVNLQKRYIKIAFRKISFELGESFILVTKCRIDCGTIVGLDIPCFFSLLERI